MCKKKAYLLRDKKACPHLNLLSNNSAVSLSPLLNKKAYQLKYLTMPLSNRNFYIFSRI